MPNFPSDLIATPQPAPPGCPKGFRGLLPLMRSCALSLSPLMPLVVSCRGAGRHHLEVLSRKPLQGTLGVLGLAFHAQDASVFCLLFLHVVMKVLWVFFFTH